MNSRGFHQDFSHPLKITIDLDVDEHSPAAGIPQDSAPDGAGSETLAQWAEAVGRIARAVQAVRLYGFDHGSAGAAIREAQPALIVCDFSVLPVLWGVAPTGFCTLEGPLNAGQAARMLASELLRHDITAIELLCRPDEAQAATLVPELVRWMADPQGQAPAGVRVIKVGAHALKFLDQSDEKVAKWAAVLQSVVSGAGEEEHPVLASAVQRVQGLLSHATEEERARASLILSDLAKRVGVGGFGGGAGGGDATASDVEATIGDLLGGMNPELRQSLLQLAAVQGTSWISDHASGLPMADLAAALLQIDADGRGASRPPDATVLLLNKLMGLTALNGDVRQKLQGVSARWNVGVGDIAKGQAVVELMTSRNVADYCPTDYRQNLQQVAGALNAQVMSPVTLADLDEKNVMAACGQIAISLLESPSPVNIDNAGPLSWFAGHASQLVTTGQTEDLWRALDCAARATGVERTPAENEAASTLIGALSLREVLEGLLNSAGPQVETTQGRDAATALLKLSPGPMLRMMLERVESGRMSPTHAIVRECVASAPQDVLSEIVREVASKPPPHVQLGAILQSVPESLLSDTAHAAYKHAASDVREFVLINLDQRMPSWPVWALNAAMLEGSRQAAERALRQAMKRPQEIDVLVLTRMLDGTSGGRLPTPQATGVIVRVLASRGVVGVAALIDVLSRFCHGVNVDRIRICRRIALELEEFRSVPDVAKALKSWRRSIGHTVGLFIVEDDGRKAA